MQTGTIRIVDDNKSVLTSLELLLEDEFERIETTSNPNRILSVLDTMPVDLVILDMNFSAGVNTGNEGLFWLRRIQEIAPGLPVIMLTAYGDVELAVKALKSGAVDFVLKPWDNDVLLEKIHTALQAAEEERMKQNAGKGGITPPSEPAMIIGHSPVMMKLIKIVTKVAKTDANVLITGENGTGKEMLAREIHRLSLRSRREMINVDMGAVSESLFESELFGHEKGAFTDARESRPGKFEAASGSTLFLDEIGNLPVGLQAKLLAALQNREVTRLGSNRKIPVDIRLIAATNRPDILDPALLRPGRFDRQVTVDRPDVKGREQILRVHAENKPMDEDVKFEKLAQMTVGFTGADLANLLNESALLAARRHRSVISMDEVEESMERVIAGPQRKGRVMTEAERTTIAYHESGHALVGHILEHSDPVHKISIVSRGQALGYTLQLPQEDHFLKTKNEMLDELAVFLGGRVAEELMCDDITSGASNDLERATKMAREMVTRLGMSEELGTQVFGEAQHQVFLGRDYADHQDYSEETARRIDIEVQRIMREAHRRAVEILDARRDQLDLMAKVLLERETVEGDAVNALLDNEWNAYLEREGDILAAKEERNAKAAGMPTKKRVPRMSEEELAADAAAFAQAAMQEDAEAASDDADDDHAVVDADTDADK